MVALLSLSEAKLCVRVCFSFKRYTITLCDRMNQCVVVRLCDVCSHTRWQRSLVQCTVCVCVRVCVRSVVVCLFVLKCARAFGIRSGNNIVIVYAPTAPNRTGNDSDDDGTGPISSELSRNPWRRLRLNHTTTFEHVYGRALALGLFVLLSAVTKAHIHCVHKCLCADVQPPAASIMHSFEWPIDSRLNNCTIIGMYMHNNYLQPSPFANIKPGCNQHTNTVTWNARKLSFVVWRETTRGAARGPYGSSQNILFKFIVQTNTHTRARAIRERQPRRRRNRVHV